MRATRGSWAGAWGACLSAVALTVVGLVVGACGEHASQGASDAGAHETSILDRTPAVDSARGDAHDAKSTADVAYPAQHEPAPRAISFGGPVLTSPTLVPIFFSGDGEQANVEAFLNAMAASSYWPAVTKEYGVGTLSIAPSIVVTDTAPSMTSDADVQAWLAGYVVGGHTGWPSLSLQNIYMVFFPTGTTITVPTLGQSCDAFGGYHFEGKIGGPPGDGGLEGGRPEGGGTGDGGGEAGGDGTAPGADAGDEASADGGGIPFVYAVIPRCGTFAGHKGLDALTVTVSHEAAEASTDPLDVTDFAYAGVDGDHEVWDFSPGGEIGDLCAFEPQSAGRLVGGYLVQRIWSNKAAATGADPCVPATSDVYFNAAPDLEDEVTLNDQGFKSQTLGLRLAVGESVTMKVRFFSASPTSSWTVYTQDSSSAFGGPALLRFEPSTFSGKDGDVALVKVTALETGPLGGTEFLLGSYRPPDVETINYWFGFVEN